jgi:nitroimidazol reductase NimA-like FMN-containing flavoprotein (pyridoxamine 5'-phosphate oxidase superfamily)
LEESYNKKIEEIIMEKNVVKLPEMSDEEIEDALQSNYLCRIAFIDENYPYISPFQYVYMSDQMYFHLTDYGKKMKIIEQNNHVCVSIENFEPDLKRYYFISLQGELVPVEDNEEKKQVFMQMLKDAKDKYSQNFLTAHGFNKEKGWEAFELKNQLIFTLIQKKKAIGLKSI